MISKDYKLIKNEYENIQAERQIFKGIFNLKNFKP